MTRPLVHLRERVRSERCSWGVINMENGREDRLRLGEEDEPPVLLPEKQQINDLIKNIGENVPLHSGIRIMAFYMERPEVSIHERPLEVNQSRSKKQM